MEERDGVVDTLTIAVAINGKRKSKYVVSWALNKFVPQGNVCFKLFHVRPRINAVPTPMGNFIPISQVRDDVVDAFRKDVYWQTSEKLHPYKMLCAKRKVLVEVLQLESDDIVEAIAQKVSNLNIIKLVIGASSRSIFSRRRSLSSRISESIPSFCTVYAVSKGKLLSVRPSDSAINGSSRAEDSNTSFSSNSSIGHTYSSLTERSDQDSSYSYSHFRSPSLPMQRFQALSSINHNFPPRRASSNVTVHHKNYSLYSGEGEDDVSSLPQGSFRTNRNDLPSSFRSLVTDNHTTAVDQASTSADPKDLSPENETDINFDLEKLRTELRHTRGMYAIAQTEVIDASRKINELQKRRLEEEIKLREISLKEEEVKELARQENEEYEAAEREADYVKECSEREAAHRKEAEVVALREAKEKDKLENALMGQARLYQEFTWEEIESSTSSFSENLKIGMGAYGTVYKCSLHHTTVAVKILHPDGSHQTKQFRQELEILCKIRHPHLLLLVGACTERGCLVYEFMENGSLEDSLLRKKHGAIPIPWFDRYRIAWEVASVLAFLHNSKPHPIIHRDLKPANILLDRSFVSKIGDVGLSTMTNSDAALSKDSGPVGTLCYIDPEYQRTGLISPQSDIYAFGMVLLQLLTAKAAMGLPHSVETAIDKGSLTKVLDSKAGEWPLEETRELAVLALKCTELCRRDRPSLKDEILPALKKLKQVADKARDCASTVQPSPPPTYYLCPLLKDVMEEPCVAADGYTYDKKAIETWLKENDRSPTTNLPLTHKNLVPNYALLSAILDWKSKKVGNT